jgi:hypothetical protein
LVAVQLVMPDPSSVPWQSWVPPVVWKLTVPPGVPPAEVTVAANEMEVPSAALLGVADALTVVDACATVSVVVPDEVPKSTVLA